MSQFDNSKICFPVPRVYRTSCTGWAQAQACPGRPHWDQRGGGRGEGGKKCLRQAVSWSAPTRHTIHSPSEAYSYAMNILSLLTAIIINYFLFCRSQFARFCLSTITHFSHLLTNNSYLSLSGVFTWIQHCRHCTLYNYCFTLWTQ